MLGPMSHTLIARERLLPGRFVRLMDFYEDNYARLERLFDPVRLVPDRYRSSVGDGFDVLLDVVERHAYTTEIRLSYDLRDPVTGLNTPSAMLRVYEDARLAEATHCLPGRQMVDVLGPFPSTQTIADHRLRMNSFLSRWLDYLREHGHGLHTLTIADEVPQQKLASG
jgi:uncharacterized protein YqiB (DUF1249 family)